jgi:hypothetical protein
MKCVESEVNKECIKLLCSTSEPSIFRRSSTPDLANTNADSFLMELQEKSPTVCDFILSILGKERVSLTEKHKYAVAMSSKERSTFFSSVFEFTDLRFWWCY